MQLESEQVIGQLVCWMKHQIKVTYSMTTEAMPAVEMKLTFKILTTMSPEYNRLGPTQDTQVITVNNTGRHLALM